MDQKAINGKAGSKMNVAIGPGCLIALLVSFAGMVPAQKRDAPDLKPFAEEIQRRNKLLKRVFPIARLGIQSQLMVSDIARAAISPDILDRYERTLLMRHYTAVCDVLVKLSLVGDSDHRRTFLYGRDLSPVSFVEKDGGVALLFEGLVGNETYNTLRLQPEERAARVVKQAVFPSLSAFSAFAEDDIKYVGFLVLFNSADFSDRNGTLGTESLVFIGPVAAIRSFAKLEITDGELLEKSEVYISDHNMGASFRRTRLRL